MIQALPAPSDIDAHIFTPSGEYARPEAEIVAEGYALWTNKCVSFRIVHGTRMPEMALTMTVDDERTFLAGFKPDGDEYCSCIPDRKDPRRCPHFWATIAAVQAQRSRSKLPPSRPGSPDVFRPSSPHVPSPLSQLRPLAHFRPLSQLHARVKPDTLGLGVIELLARSQSFVPAFRAAFKAAYIETLTASLLAQLFRAVDRGFWVDYANVFTALKVDGLLDKFADPTDLLQRIILHCDRSAGSSLYSLLQWEAEAFVRCTACHGTSFGPTTYTRWCAKVYPGAVATDRLNPHTAAGLHRLLELSLFDTTYIPCQRCKNRTLHIVKHTPLIMGRLLLVRVVPDADPGSLYIPPQFTDSALGYSWNLVGMLCAHRGGYSTIVAEGGRLIELVGGMAQQHSVRSLPAPPALILYEREGDEDWQTSGHDD
ncbi:unnamed protein product [Cutaneotrichosporon oleaginosum]